MGPPKTHKNQPGADRTHTKLVVVCFSLRQPRLPSEQINLVQNLDSTDVTED